MIPKHTQFIAAIKSKKKVAVRFDSRSDRGVLDRVCAPIDFGPGHDFQDGLNRYWFWEYSSDTGAHPFGLLPLQILDLHVLGESFEPSKSAVTPLHWYVPRDWGSPS